ITSPIDLIAWVKTFIQLNALPIGMSNLDTYVRDTVIQKEGCKSPKIVLVGYSFGAVIVNEWLSKNQDLWQYIKAVELYGDMLWYRKGPPFPGGSVDTYEGVLRGGLLSLLGLYDPYTSGFPQGPKGKDGDLSDRWQSRCRKGDAFCGEGKPGVDALLCQPIPFVPPCEHQ